MYALLNCAPFYASKRHTIAVHLFFVIMHRKG
jgi:hypothetical protein